MFTLTMSTYLKYQENNVYQVTFTFLIFRFIKPYKFNIFKQLNNTELILIILLIQLKQLLFILHLEQLIAIYYLQLNDQHLLIVRLILSNVLVCRYSITNSYRKNCVIYNYNFKKQLTNHGFSFAHHNTKKSKILYDAVLILFHSINYILNI